MVFWQLTVATSHEASDGLTNFLWEQGALGVVEEEFPTEPPRLRAFFPDTASPSALLHVVRVYRASLRSLGFPVAGPEPEITPLHDAAWASAWQQSFPPRQVGERLLVTPPWEARPDGAGARAQVIIEPGRAFGTGHHGSTEGCLVLLEEALRRAALPPRLSRDAGGGSAGSRDAAARDATNEASSMRVEGEAPEPPKRVGLVPRPPGRVLDIGTGTGILAVAAVKLGAPSARAIDVDPDAIRAAQLNAERNGCADRIMLDIGGPETLSGTERFPLVLANLLSHTHLAFVPHYARLAAPGGALILGGILVDEDREVAEVVEAAGFVLVARQVIEGWASLLFENDP
jgi:ribosomal protein L11 methyltransferase